MVRPQGQTKVKSNFNTLWLNSSLVRINLNMTGVWNEKKDQIWSRSSEVKVRSNLILLRSGSNLVTINLDVTRVCNDYRALRTRLVKVIWGQDCIASTITTVGVGNTYRKRERKQCVIKTLKGALKCSELSLCKTMISKISIIETRDHSFKAGIQTKSVGLF